MNSWKLKVHFWQLIVNDYAVLCNDVKYRSLHGYCLSEDV